MGYFSDKSDMADDTVIRYNDIGGSMSKPLLNQTEEMRIRDLLNLLRTKESANESPEVREAKREILKFVESCLDKKPVLLEKDLSPTEAGEIAGVSRTTITNLIKSGRLQGYEVGTHWRVKRESLQKYMSDREEFAEGMARMDGHGFGTD
jgi:excisionase family DNA binding protein